MGGTIIYTWDNKFAKFDMGAWGAMWSVWVASQLLKEFWVIYDSNPESNKCKNTIYLTFVLILWYKVWVSKCAICWRAWMISVYSSSRPSLGGKGFSPKSFKIHCQNFLYVGWEVEISPPQSVESHDIVPQNISKFVICWRAWMMLLKSPSSDFLKTSNETEFVQKWSQIQREKCLQT